MGYRWTEDGPAFEFPTPFAVENRLLAWRGWSISDRITGISESLLLPDLPVYQADGPIPLQRRDIHVFREIDGRAGYALSASYSYSSRIDLNALHYDNRGDPLVVRNGQYSWWTRFDQLGMRWRAPRHWEFLAQAMRGSTAMGPNAVNIDFRSGYLLAVRPFGPGRIAVRYDRFQIDEQDALPEDPNSESGHSWTLAYRVPLANSWQLVLESTLIDSSRPARALLAEPVRQMERSLLAGVRWNYP